MRILVVNVNTTDSITQAIARQAQSVAAPGTEIIGLTRSDCDLENWSEVDRVFREVRPDQVYHLAARVGGIKANISDPVGFLDRNLLSQTHVFRAAHQAKTKPCVSFARL